ncbi:MULTISPECIES: hypothetical protein [Nocardia]|uniref:hypothetical protein n=1 Tax=Nocardia TaxID=1817 RepID=UPI000B19F437|nr:MULTISPECIES: hypothetical protein [Nocardia]MBF6273336.1 hypothetical protein [Nocardia nova]MBV7703416.1 hypothetical protein [Nocardia nova]
MTELESGADNNQLQHLPARDNDCAGQLFLRTGLSPITREAVRDGHGEFGCITDKLDRSDGAAATFHRRRHTDTHDRGQEPRLLP